MNSTSLITNGLENGGLIVGDIQYYPFGQTRRQTGLSNEYQYKFNNKEKNNITGLYDYGARYYDSQIGKFISPDPLIMNIFSPANLNLYNFVENNPINLVDPTGMFNVRFFNQPKIDFRSMSRFSGINNLSIGKGKGQGNDDDDDDDDDEPVYEREIDMEPLVIYGDLWKKDNNSPDMRNEDPNDFELLFGLAESLEKNMWPLYVYTQTILLDKLITHNPDFYRRLTPRSRWKGSAFNRIHRISNKFKFYRGMMKQGGPKVIGSYLKNLDGFYKLGEGDYAGAIETLISAIPGLGELKEAVEAGTGQQIDFEIVTSFWGDLAYDLFYGDE